MGPPSMFVFRSVILLGIDWNSGYVYSPPVCRGRPFVLPHCSSSKSVDAVLAFPVFPIASGRKFNQVLKDVEIAFFADSCLRTVLSRVRVSSLPPFRSSNFPTDHSNSLSIMGLAYFLLRCSSVRPSAFPTPTQHTEPPTFRGSAVANERCEPSGLSGVRTSWVSFLAAVLQSSLWMRLEDPQFWGVFRDWGIPL